MTADAFVRPDERFFTRIKNLLGDRYHGFEESLCAPCERAFRIQRSRAGKVSVLEIPGLGDLADTTSRIPWEENAFYFGDGSFPGRHPYHEAGLYYIQEPSAMAPVYYLDPRPGERVLDLCAAPGGKSAQIADRMGGEGILVSNEYDASRSKILSSNIERLGVSNCVVVNADPGRLAENFAGYFDRILVDAPCSGEGMMRKNPEAALQWSTELVTKCAERQRAILEQAVKMLAPGGRLVYSTCTFAPEEDEDNVRWLLETHRELVPFKITPPKESGALCGLCDDEWNGACIRMFPHLSRGEGHFAAVLVKQAQMPDEKESVRFKKDPEAHSRRDDKIISAFCGFMGSAGAKEFCDKLLERGVVVPDKDSLSLIPADTSYRRRLAGIHVVREGIRLGSAKEDRNGVRFEPDHALSHMISPADMEEHVCLSPDSKEAVSFIKGESLRDLSCMEGKGYRLVCAGGYSLGWGKLASGVLKNHYPKGIRKDLSGS